MPKVKYSLSVVGNNLSSNFAWPKPKSRYTPDVKKSEPTTTVTGQKNIRAESSVKTNEDIKVIIKRLLVKFFFNSIDQNPWKKRRNDETKYNGKVT